MHRANVAIVETTVNKRNQEFVARRQVLLDAAAPIRFLSPEENMHYQQSDALHRVIRMLVGGALLHWENEKANINDLPPANDIADQSDDELVFSEACWTQMFSYPA